MQLQTQIKKWIMIIKEDDETLFQKQVDEKEMNGMIEALNKKPQHVMVQGFGTTSYRNIQFRSSDKDDWGELDKYTNDIAKKEEINKGIQQRERIKKYFKENQNIYNTIMQTVYSELMLKQWFTMLSHEAQETLTISKCAIIAQQKGLIK